MFQYFVLICILSIHSLNRIFHRGKKIILRKFNLSTFPFMNQAFVASVRALCLTIMFLFFPKYVL